MIPWTSKYSPKSTSDIIGQENAVATLRSFVSDFKKKKKRALMLYGSPGSGKTSSVYAAAREMNLEVLEVNASDFRDEEKLNASVGQASKQMSLFARGKILLVDEVDGVFGHKDRGAVPMLVGLTKATAFPVVFTTNDPWDKKFSPLRAACELVEFKRLDQQTVLNLLRRVCEAEKITYEEKALATLARRSGGDVRGVLIDLQSLIENGSFGMAQVDLLGERHQTDSIFNALMKIFKTTDAFVARMAFENVEEDLDEILLWIDENLPKEYTKPDDLVRAYEKMSRADVFRGRIMKRQHWHFLTVVGVLLSPGIALAKDEKYSTFVRYGPTQRILKIWRANMHNLQRKSIAQKIAKKTHCGTKAAFHETIPYLQVIFRANKIAASLFVRYFDLNKDEADWLVGR